MAIRQPARTDREHTMPAQPQSRDHRRFRLAANDNETVVDEQDTEGHRLAANDNETTVPNLRRVAGDDEDENPEALGARRMNKH
jgi:hypothetical protein